VILLAAYIAANNPITEMQQYDCDTRSNQSSSLTFQLSCPSPRSLSRLSSLSLVSREPVTANTDPQPMQISVHTSARQMVRKMKESD